MSLSRLLRAATALAATLTASLALVAVPAQAAPAPPTPVACSGCWHPALNTSWNWVLSTVPSAPYRAVNMYDVDGFDSTTSSVASLHSAGIKAVCYISAGTWENWRPDASSFPTALRGKNVGGWAGEKWLDIRDVQKPSSVLRSLMDSRLDMCHAKGFDAVELDNVDGYLNPSGFPLSASDQLYYDSLLANDTHARGMSVLQKNDNEQIPSLLPYFDGALNEQCNQYNECTTAQNGSYGLNQYVAAGKASVPGRIQPGDVEILLEGQRQQLQRRPVQHQPQRLDLPALPLAPAVPLEGRSTGTSTAVGAASAGWSR